MGLQRKHFFKHYLPILCGAGFIFGILFGLVGLAIGSGIGTFRAAVSGTVIGFLIGSILGGVLTTIGSLFVLLTQSLMKRMESMSSPCLQRQKVEVCVSREEAYNLCKKAILTLPNTTIVSKSFDPSIIIARKAMSIISWGQDLECEILSLSPARQLISIQSQPIVKTILFDYGTNSRNVAHIEAFLLANCQRQVHVLKDGQIPPLHLSEKVLATEKNYNSKIDE